MLEKRGHKFVTKTDLIGMFLALYEMLEVGFKRPRVHKALPADLPDLQVCMRQVLSFV